MPNDRLYHYTDDALSEKTLLLGAGRTEKLSNNTQRSSSGYYSITCKDDFQGDPRECSFKSISSFDSFEEEEDSGISRQDILASTNSFILTLVEKLVPEKKSSLFLTICTILPVLHGSAVLGVPYAFMVGGKAFLPASILICILATICSKLLIDCMYEISPRSQLRKRVYGMYEDLAFACWGRAGKNFLKAITILYFAMNNVVNIVLLFKSLDNLLSDVKMSLPSNNILGCLFVLLFLPFLFGIKEFSILAYLGLCGTISVLVVCITSVIILVDDSCEWKKNFDEMPMIDLQKFPVAISIIMYTLVVAPTIPIIEGTMSDRTQATAAIYISFGVSSLSKIFFGAIGYLTFGMLTMELIATNISIVSQTARYIISTMLLVYVFCNTIYYTFILMDMIDGLFINNVSNEIARGKRYRVPWMIVSRPICLAILTATGHVMPYFALVSSVVGAICGSFLAFIAPVYFHVKLKWYEMSFKRKLCECLLLVVNISLGLISTYTSMSELIHTINSQGQI